MTGTRLSVRVGVVVPDLNGSGAPHNYIIGLLRALASDPHTDPLLVYARGDSTGFPDIETVQQSRGSYPTRFLPDRPMLPDLPAVETAYDVDLFHLNRLPDIGNWTVVRTRAPVVATLHGTLHWERIPAEEQPRAYRVRRRLFDRLGRYTLDRVLTVSDYVRMLLLQRVGYSSSQVMTTYEAISNSFFTYGPTRRLTDDTAYILHVSNAASKKNLPTLLRAFATLHKKHNIRLEIAGRGWEARCSSLASDLGVADSVRFRGYIPETELISLYDHAACFIYPSYHETFGRPNVEAMARGTPVVTSDRFAIPEIVGDGALTVSDPGDPDAVASSIHRVLTEAGLRSALIRAGHKRAKRFRWTRHRADVIGAYRSILSK